jgi:hypothetical protein
VHHIHASTTRRYLCQGDGSCLKRTWWARRTWVSSVHLASKNTGTKRYTHRQSALIYLSASSNTFPGKLVVCHYWSVWDLWIIHPWPLFSDHEVPSANLFLADINVLFVSYSHHQKTKKLRGTSHIYYSLSFIFALESQYSAVKKWITTHSLGHKTSCASCKLRIYLLPYSYYFIPRGWWLDREMPSCAGAATSVSLLDLLIYKWLMLTP